MGNVHMEATQINYRGGSKKMSVEEAIKAAGTEITPEEKTWIDSIPALTSSNAGKTDQDVIAPEFDAEAGVYAVGDKVMYDGKLYEFTTAHETPGDWDSSEVSETTVADELNSLESGLTNYENQNNLNLEVPNRKNLLPLVSSDIKRENTSGTWSGNTYTLNNVTFDLQTDDGENITGIKVNGTANAVTSFFLTGYGKFLTAGTNYTLNGCMNGASNTYKLDLLTSTVAITTSTTGDGDHTPFTITNSVDYRARITVYSGVNVSNQMFYPMIRLATETDATFAPYIPSVESRIEAVEKSITVSRVTVSPDVNGYVNLSTSGFTKVGYRYVNAVVTGSASARSYDVKVWLSDTYGWIATIYTVDTFTKVTDTTVSLDLVVFGVTA